MTGYNEPPRVDPFARRPTPLPSSPEHGVFTGLGIFLVFHVILVALLLLATSAMGVRGPEVALMLAYGGIVALPKFYVPVALVGFVFAATKGTRPAIGYVLPGLVLLAVTVGFKARDYLRIREAKIERYDNRIIPIKTGVLPGVIWPNGAGGEPVLIHERARSVTTDFSGMDGVYRMTTTRLGKGEQCGTRPPTTTMIQRWMLDSCLIDEDDRPKIADFRPPEGHYVFRFENTPLRPPRALVAYEVIDGTLVRRHRWENGEFPDGTSGGPPFHAQEMIAELTGIKDIPPVFPESVAAGMRLFAASSANGRVLDAWSFTIALRDLKGRYPDEPLLGIDDAQVAAFRSSFRETCLKDRNRCMRIVPPYLKTIFTPEAIDRLSGVMAPMPPGSQKAHP